MKSLFFVSFFGLAQFAFSQSITFSEHIAPIVYNKCTSCHRPGEIAPFSLTNYSEVSAWANMIQYVTEIGYMPPWKPDQDYQRYQKENFLSQEEKQLINDWVSQGAVQGDPQLETELPVFPTGSQVGIPDLTLNFAQSYLHQGNNLDEYRYFVIPTGLTEDKNIRSIEFRPGNKRIVHHTLIWEDTTGNAAAADAATPEYGYSESEGAGVNLGEMQLPGYVPGAAPVIYSNGITQKLHAGSDLKLQMHYAPSPVDESDSSSINIFFENDQANRELQGFVMVPIPGIIQNGPFIIPANETRLFHGSVDVPFDVSLYSIAPHCHLLGTDWLVYAVKPDNDTIPLISIPDWDFNWQGSYQFRSLIKVPAGSVIHAYAGYDNTSNNPFNPNDPPQFVTWGEGTSDEMFYLPLAFLPYQAGDENIVFEEEQTVGNFELQAASLSDKLYPAFPSPSQNNCTARFTIQKTGALSLRLLSLDGVTLKTIVNKKTHLPGYHTIAVDLSELSPGTYLLEFEKDNVRQVEKVIVIR